MKHSAWSADAFNSIWPETSSSKEFKKLTPKLHLHPLDIDFISFPPLETFLVIPSRVGYLYRLTRHMYTQWLDSSEQWESRVTLESRILWDVLLIINRSDPVAMYCMLLFFDQVDKTKSPVHRQHRLSTYTLSGHQSCDIPPWGVREKKNTVQVCSITYLTSHCA